MISSYYLHTEIRLFHDKKLYKIQSRLGGGRQTNVYKQ